MMVGSMGRGILAALACAAAMMTTPAAAATFVDAVYSGTVTDGIDGAALFGVADGDLTGESFVSTFRFDLDQMLSSFGYDWTVFGPPISASVEVGGVGYDLDLSAVELSAFQNGLFDGPGAPYFFHAPIFVTSGAGVFSTGDGDSLLASFGDAYDASIVTLSPTFTGQTHNGAAIFSLGGALTEGDVEITSFSISRSPPEIYFLGPSGGIPEPSAWTLLIVGLALVGERVRLIARAAQQIPARRVA